MILKISKKRNRKKLINLKLIKKLLQINKLAMITKSKKLNVTG